MKIAALKIKTIILIGEVKDMRLRKRVKVLEGMVSDLIRKNETLQDRLNDLEEEFDTLIEPVVEAFEEVNGRESKAPTEKENKNELDYKGVIDEWLNGSANGTNK